MHVYDFILPFSQALIAQLKDDEKRHGDTWLHRSRAGQEDRIWTEFNGYFRQYYDLGQPIPWLKIAGNAMIAWIREQHPEIWKE